MLKLWGKILIISYLFFCPFCVKAATNPYKPTQVINGKVVDNCTYIAWKAAYERLGIVLPGWGNANTWLRSAYNAGFSTGRVPKANSIVVFDNGSKGHVAFVIDYDPEEEVYTLYNERTMSIYEYEINGYGTLGYIYLDEPRKETNNSSGETNNNSTSKETTTTLSSNSALKSLTIENINFEFQKDTFTYFLTVPYEQEEIIVKAEADSSKAKITGLDTYKLNIGENIITIKVVAEDNSTSQYVLNIIREEEQKTKEDLEIVENVIEPKNNNFYYILGGSLFILIVVILSIWQIKKHHRNNEVGKQ